MTTSQEFVQFETSSINLTASVQKRECELEEVFFKSPEKQFKNIQGCWWIELSCRSKEKNSSYNQIKGYLQLKVQNEALIKSGLYPHVDFIVDNERLGTDGSFVGVREVIKKTNSVFCGTRPTSVYWTFSLEVTVVLTLRYKRMIEIESSPVSHKEIDEHWIKTSPFSIMYDQDDFKDFTFIIEKQEFKVHKLIVAGSSEVLRTMFMSGLSESKSNSTIVTDIDAEVFQVLVDFMYGKKDEFYKTFKNFVFAVFKAAHKYEIKVLQDFCVDFISEYFTDPGRAIKTFAFASFYGLEYLKEKCWNIIKIDILEDETLEPPKEEDIGVFFKELQHYQEEMEKIKRQIKQKMSERTQN